MIKTDSSNLIVSSLKFEKIFKEKLAFSLQTAGLSGYSDLRPGGNPIHCGAFRSLKFVDIRLRSRPAAGAGHETSPRPRAQRQSFLRKNASSPQLNANAAFIFPAV
ncbi:hypothetical protein EVAR_62093_1 [Eumeta japonica]|uniref:Uncharacterized protein n=1 Tax=Eumeta variegata TaxID=151549 RepID=A0A4C1Z1K4_EUMVA|nr:hypothetical protein EVAR_62093_1 [Eumeta japonica]